MLSSGSATNTGWPIVGIPAVRGGTRHGDFDC
jgi:hypothetical protein